MPAALAGQDPALAKVESKKGSARIPATWENLREILSELNPRWSER